MNAQVEYTMELSPVELRDRFFKNWHAHLQAQRRGRLNRAGELKKGKSKYARKRGKRK